MTKLSCMSKDSIKAPFESSFEKYTDLEWLCTKWTFLPLWILMIGSYTLAQKDYSKVANGVCDYLGCSSYLYTAPYNCIIFGIFSLLSLMYLLEIKMVVATFGLFLVSLLVFSYYENYLGGCGELGLVSLIFFVQLIAYIRASFNGKLNLNKERIYFPLQLLAAAYTLTAVAKLRASGVDWFTSDAKNFAAHVLRYHYSAYVSYGVENFRIKGEIISDFIFNNLLVTKVALGAVLVLELSAFVLMLGKKFAFAYGVLIVFFHLGVLVIMNLFIPSFAISIIALSINPLYGLVTCIRKIVEKVS